jgi:hypothetical protein
MATLSELGRRLARAWRRLTPEQRVASVAAVALTFTLFLPWYQLQSLDLKSRQIITHSVTAFGVFSFVEAAITLVALGVLVLVFLRGERRGFHLPGGDGTVIAAGGGWSAFLLFFRVFDRPGGAGYPVGIEWGFFIAFLAAGFLTYAGVRMRGAHEPEPPLPPTAERRAAPPDAAPVPRRRARHGATSGPPRPDEGTIPGQLSFDEAETQRRQRDS